MNLSCSYKYCAGALPYTYFNNSIYFLLGKSKRNNRLATFSGKSEEFDMDECDTAARECYEETLGCLMDRASLLDRIKKCRNSHIVMSTTPRGKPCFTYVVEVPFRKYYSVSFHKTKDFLQSQNIRSYGLQEMSDIKWICANSMFTKIRRQWEKSDILNDDFEWCKLLKIANFEYTELQTWRKPIEDDTILSDIEDEK